MRLPTKNRVTLPYNSSAYPYSSTNRHAGTDYAFTPDDSIYAPEKLTITRRGYLGDCGNSIDAQGSGGRSYRFCHMSRYSLRSRLKTAPEGARLGKMGDSGRAMGKHLHFIMWEGQTRVDGDKTIKKIMEQDMYKGHSAKYYYDKTQDQEKKLKATRAERDKYKNAYKKCKAGGSADETKLIEKLTNAIKGVFNK